jgi:plastocyanin
MKRNAIFFLVALSVGICCLAGPAFTAEEKIAEQVQEPTEELKIINKIIAVTRRDISTQTLTSSPGTTVIWINRDRSPSEILFLDKKVVLACGSPVNFIIGESGAYESGKIPFGGTASLCFTEKGRYDYIVRTSASAFAETTKKELRGTVLIK